MENKRILRFTDNYAFLSNFYEAPIIYNGVKYRNGESAYQAQKCPERSAEFTTTWGAAAKKLGKEVALRADWDEIKLPLMYEIVKAKFTQNPELAARLKSTGDAELIEGNYWHDTYWGVCSGKGENNLGKILMKVRDEL